MNKIDAMHAFVRVAELSSFTLAAQSLGISKANISGLIQSLEEWLGTRLFHRTTRKVHLTEDGQAFYERCKDLLADMEELETIFQHGPEQVSGRLRVDMTTGMAKNIIIPRLPEFLNKHPKLEVQLSSTDRKVDLVREGFDCVVRVGTLNDSSLIARSLGKLKLINCASPTYLKTYGIPETLDDLARHQLIHYVPIFGAKSSGWEYWDGTANTSINMSGALTVNNGEAYEAACLAGLGLIQAPEIAVRHHIQQGRLVDVLPGYLAAPMPISLLYANRRHLSKRIRVFMDWVAEVFRQYLESPIFNSNQSLLI